MSSAKGKFTTPARHPDDRDSIGHTRKPLPLRIRWMLVRDLPEVLVIESLCFPDAPWTEGDFTGWLQRRNCIGMVVECDDHRSMYNEKLIGFMIYELHKTRLRVLNFAVHSGFRRQGVGTRMVEKLVDKLSSCRRSRITLEVRETNLPAQLFFRALGFKATDVLRNFYPDDVTGEDAYIFEYGIGQLADCFGR